MASPTVSCTGCRAPMAPEARFCGGCGAAQTPGNGAAAQEERNDLRPDAWGTPPPAWKQGADGRWADRAGRTAAAVTLAALFVVGGSVAYAATRSADSPLPPSSSAPAPASAMPAPVPTPSASPPTARPTASTPPGGTPVSITSTAVDSPYASTVASLLGRYFGAINTKDYDAWMSTVSARRAGDQTRQGWLDGFGSTTDSDVVVSSITSTGADSAVATVSFVSRQAVADAPDDLPYGTICWQQTLPIERIGSAPLVGVTTSGSTRGSAC